jgi:putative peptidoglycan lipid II flippase
MGKLGPWDLGAQVDGMVEGADSAAQTMPQEQRTRGRHAARRKKDQGGLARSSLLTAIGTVVRC